jgi:uncharacterized delta-60 repeat protein
MKSIILTLLVLVAFSSHQLFAQAGNLDSTFNNDGKVLTFLGSLNDVAFSVIMQPDGKIVIAGTSNNGTDYDFAALRYNSDGSLDNSFGTDGYVVTPISIGGTIMHFVLHLILREKLSSVVVLTWMISPGMILLLSGIIQMVHPMSNFGVNGIVTTGIGTGDNAGFGMLALADEKILMTGTAMIDHIQGNNSDFALVRYDATGALDPLFGTNGLTTTDFNNADDIPHDLNWIPMENFYCRLDHPSDHSAFAVARYDANGILDPTFGNGGTTFTSLDSNSYAYNSGVQADGKIVAGGYTGDFPNGDFVLIRYNTDGTLDPTFR